MNDDPEWDAIKDAQPITTRDIEIDANGFLLVAGIKVCKLNCVSGRMQFIDKDRKRAIKRGTRFVEMDVAQFMSTVRKECETHPVPAVLSKVKTGL